MIGVALVMTYLARRRRFGRYVYAIGGNPEAAELGGINVRRTIMFTFVLMGVLCAVSAAVQTARLNAAVTNLGVQNELDVISAAVIGGTSFAGGIGTIPGAVLGAVVMQSLRSGMVLLKVDSPTQDIVVGIVLVAAVGLDSALRRRVVRERRRRTVPGARSSRCATSGCPFGGVHAVDGVSVDLHAGEVVALVGGNGAGKSTLMRVLSGAHPADSGEILINGEPTTINNPRDARAHGIEAIYQTLALADNIDAAANVFLGREMLDPHRGARRLGHGVGDARGDAPPQPAVHEPQDARQVAVGRPAPGGRDRPRHPLQRPDPDHGRADGGARSGRDRPGPRARRPAEVGGHRHLPHQPRHPRRVRPRRPDQRHAHRASSSAR